MSKILTFYFRYIYPNFITHFCFAPYQKCKLGRDPKIERVTCVCGLEIKE